jgi:hypothetical protein
MQESFRQSRLVSYSCSTQKKLDDTETPTRITVYVALIEIVWFGIHGLTIQDRVQYRKIAC